MWCRQAQMLSEGTASQNWSQRASSRYRLYTVP